MTAEYREQLFDKLTARMKEVLTAKGNDYANEDVLSNFKLAGSICQITPQQHCLALIATKVARLGTLFTGKTPKNEAIEDSIIDLINYGFLLYCIEDEAVKQELKSYIIDNIGNSVISLPENQVIDINDKQFVWRDGTLEELPF